MRDYKLGILNPNESREIVAPGNFFRLAKADSAVEVTAHGDGDQKPMRTEVKPNGKRKPDEVYKRWQIKNISALAQEITVTIGIGDADESEVTLSADVSVNKLPTGLDNTLKGTSFVAAFKVNAQAGNYSTFGIYLPNGSTKKVAIDKICITSMGNGQEYKIGYTNYQAVNTTQLYASTDLTKNPDITLSEAQVNTGTTATAIGAYISIGDYQYENILMEYHDPILIDGNASAGGRGIYVQTSQTQQNIKGTMVFREIDLA